MVQWIVSKATIAESKEYGVVYEYCMDIHVWPGAVKPSNSTHLVDIVS